MKAFICVYRHSDPSPSEWNNTMTAACTDPRLQQFMNGYRQPSSFYDWGDDPGFFAASQILGNPSEASWGVCRRDVRSQLSPGDFVVWFCTRSQPNRTGYWDYYFVGCTTVAHTIDRFQLWSLPHYLPYQSFYNTLARPHGGALIQHETFHDYHDDWQYRAAAPYIIFDGSPSLSAVNLTNPAHVATGTAGTSEVWLSPQNPKVAQIEATIFTTLQVTRRLRTSHPQRPHRHIALHNAPAVPLQNRDTFLANLRTSILALV